VTQKVGTPYHALLRDVNAVKVIFLGSGKFMEK
jgi:hypothetical protein